MDRYNKNMCVMSYANKMQKQFSQLLMLWLCLSMQDEAIHTEIYKDMT